MVIKTILASIVSLNRSLPFVVLLLLIIIAQTTYLLIDHYVIDLTPSVGTYYNGRIANIEQSLIVISKSCKIIPNEVKE